MPRRFGLFSSVLILLFAQFALNCNAVFSQITVTEVVKSSPIAGDAEVIGGWFNKMDQSFYVAISVSNLSARAKDVQAGVGIVRIGQNGKTERFLWRDIPPQPDGIAPPGRLHASCIMADEGFVLFGNLNGPTCTGAKYDRSGKSLVEREIFFDDVPVHFRVSQSIPTDLGDTLVVGQRFAILLNKDLRVCWKYEMDDAKDGTQSRLTSAVYDPVRKSFLITCHRGKWNKFGELLDGKSIIAISQLSYDGKKLAEFNVEGSNPRLSADGGVVALFKTTSSADLANLEVNLYSPEMRNVGKIEFPKVHPLLVKSMAQSDLIVNSNGTTYCVVQSVGQRAICVVSSTGKNLGDLRGEWDPSMGLRACFLRNETRVYVVWTTTQFPEVTTQSNRTHIVINEVVLPN